MQGSRQPGATALAACQAAASGPHLAAAGAGQRCRPWAHRLQWWQWALSRCHRRCTLHSAVIPRARRCRRRHHRHHLRCCCSLQLRHVLLKLAAASQVLFELLQLQLRWRQQAGLPGRPAELPCQQLPHQHPAGAGRRGIRRAAVERGARVLVSQQQCMAVQQMPTAAAAAAAAVGCQQLQSDSGSNGGSAAEWQPGVGPAAAGCSTCHQELHTIMCAASNGAAADWQVTRAQCSPS